MTTAARTYSEESNHWYDPRNGEPCHEVARSDGKGMRATTLRDAKKIGLVPSVTNVLRILAKPALESWKQEQALLAVLTSPRLNGEADDAFVHRILKEERVQSQEADAARQRGIRGHDALCKLFRGEEIESDIELWVMPAFEQLCRGSELVATEKFLACEHYGGQLDLIQSIERESPCFRISDFKFRRNIPKAPYPEEELQCAAYANLLNHWQGDTRGIITQNVYVSTTNCGEFAIMEHGFWTTTYGQGFAPLLRYWQWANGMLS